MKEPLVSRLLRISLYGIFILGVLFILTLPWMLERYTGYLYDAYMLVPGYRIFILCFLSVVCALTLWAVAEMILLTRSIPNDPFVAKNTRALKRIGIISSVLSVLFFGKCVLYITYLTLGCGFIFLVGALFAFTLSDLFRQAVTFKDENALTI